METTKSLKEEQESEGGAELGEDKRVSPIPKERENLVEVAVKFLNNPRVVNSPLEQKKSFLKKKGLTESEIDEAVRLSRLAPPPPPPPPRTPSQLPVTAYHYSHHRSWRDYALAVAVLGGIGYTVYKFVRGYVIPWLTMGLEQNERIDDISQAIREIQSNLDTTVSSLSESTTSIRDVLNQQQQQIEIISDKVSALQAIGPGSALAVSEIKDEMTSLKGLLLNRHQFPVPSSAANPQQRAIPSWQRSTQQETVTLANNVNDMKAEEKGEED